MDPKHEMRRFFIEKRLDISNDRRKQAREQVVETLLPQLENYVHILSFASKREEIDLWPLNEILAKEKRLYLPRIVEGHGLVAYLVTNIETDLEESGHWKIKEPRLDRCDAIPQEKLDCVLVPGLGFDEKNHRLGYGIGHFDRFLAGLTSPTFGIGFKEQRSSELLPVESHDVALTDVFLF